MAKGKKLLKDCPLNDKKCNDCEQKKACQKLREKNKKSLLSKLRKILIR
ncbi:MAG: hypothetical protein NTX00_02370 [Candidatus Parcubacteria bacterium]|nr:hypothetical protein [Candidatus Parcubacteria bacterium]